MNQKRIKMRNLAKEKKIKKQKNEPKKNKDEGFGQRIKKKQQE